MTRIKMDILIKKFIHTGKIHHIVQYIKYVEQCNCPFLALYIAECVYSVCSFNIDFLLEIALIYNKCGFYEKSFSVFNILLNHSCLSESKFKQILTESMVNTPTLLNQKIPLQILPDTPFPTVPIVTFSITTCKRYDLFERTMNSFIFHCKDIGLISSWICVDDNSSDEDRLKMLTNFPFFKFIWKTPEQKGHAQSMNLILDTVKTPYLFHMEDDWEFFVPSNYIRPCIEILNESDEYGQCLINKNYAETIDGLNIQGGIYSNTKGGLSYYVHEFEPNAASFAKKYGPGSNCAYWPHYSLRPGLNKVSCLKSTGRYNPSASHFEMDFAYRYTVNYKTTFLNRIYCTHIGRLTKDRHLETATNAYTLNKEQQFVTKQNRNSRVECFVINMENRQDRYTSFSQKVEKEALSIPVKRHAAVNGYNLKPNRYIEQVFNFNDYNYRKGMIGCALSHMELWVQLFPTQGVYLILEDDVSFVPYFDLKLNHLLENLAGVQWDIVFLGHHVYKQYKNKSTYNEYTMPTIEKWSTSRSLTESAGGTGGYLISSQGALKLLSFISSCGMTNGIDTMMQKACDLLEVYYCTPHLIYSDWYSQDCMESVDTDIQRNYDSLGRSIEERLKEEEEFYKSLNIKVQHCNCTETNVDVHKEDCIVFCKNNCRLTGGESFYHLDTIRVCISSYLSDQKPCLLNIGLVENGNFTLKNMIQYIKC